MTGRSDATARGEDSGENNVEGGPSEADRARGRCARRLVFVLYVVVVAFFVLEASTRLVATPRKTAFVPSTDPKLVYELDPRLDGVNAQGFRGPLFEDGGERESEAAFVVAVLGDSHTFGVEVRRDADTYPRRIESRLAETAPDANVRVLNFGVPGYNTAQELALFETRVVPLSPDVVILQYTINDTHVCNYIQPEHPRLNWLVHRSAFAVWLVEQLLYSESGRRHLFDRVGRCAPDLLLYREGLVGTLRIGPDADPARAGHPPRSPDDVPPRYHYMLGRENLARHLERFGEVARAHGIALVATGFIEEDDRALFRDAGFIVYSFDDAFTGLDMAEHGGYDAADTSDHFDARGNLVVGHRLADFLRERFLEDADD